MASGLRERAKSAAVERIMAAIAPAVVVAEFRQFSGFFPGVRGSMRRAAARRLREIRGEPESNPWRSRFARARITESFWLRLVAAFDGGCAYCGKDTRPLTVDHVTPRAALGRGGEDDVLPACGACNSRKQHRSVEWLLARMGIDEQEFWSRVKARRERARQTDKANP